MFSRWDYWEYRRWRRRRRRRFAAFLAVAFLLVAARRRARHRRPVRPRNTGFRRRSPAPRPLTIGRPSGLPPRRALTGRAIQPAGDGLSWTDFYGIELPGSAQDGPRHARHGLAWGFADTPGGALARGDQHRGPHGRLVGPGDLPPTIRNQVTGPDKAALLAADASDYAALRAAGHVQPWTTGRPRVRRRGRVPFRRLRTGRRHGRRRHRRARHRQSTVLVATRIEVVWRRR